jgi:hypothetical protein
MRLQSLSEPEQISELEEQLRLCFCDHIFKREYDDTIELVAECYEIEADTSPWLVVAECDREYPG